MPIITSELAAFLEGPNSIIVGTQDGTLAPECCRGLAIRCDAADRVTVWLPASVSARTEANLTTDARIAVAAERPSTHKTLQLKGTVELVRAAPDSTRALLDQAFALFIDECTRIGLPHRLLDRVVRWPVMEVAMHVTALYEQTPGPGAGERYAGAGA